MILKMIYSWIVGSINSQQIVDYKIKNKQQILCLSLLVQRKMDQNNKVISQMLQQQGYDATQQAKQAIIDFSVLYAKKLITKCTKGGKLNPTLDDVRLGYQVMNKMHSTEYEAELNQRKAKLIYYINKDLNAQKFEKTPAEISTVSLYPNSENPHMRTAWEYQIAFENS